MDFDFDFESDDEESSDPAIKDKSFYGKIMEDASKAASILNIHLDVAFLCLQQAKFDLERLLSEYVLDSSSFLSNLNIRPENVQHSQRMVRGNKSENMTCEVCYNDYSGDHMLSLPCGHFFCEDCWRDSIMSHTHKIDIGKDDQVSYNIDESSSSESLDISFNTDILKCMENGCNSVILPSDVEMLCSKNAEKAYIRRFNQKSIDTAVLVKRCSNPRCKLLLNIDSIGPCGLVQCKCSAWTCWKCGGKAHAPLQCQNVAKWKSLFNKCANALWISNNTKQCPKCKLLIEKNGGCNHMTCQNCNYEFCWFCGHEWSTHTGNPYECLSKDYKNVDINQAESFESDNNQIKNEIPNDGQKNNEKISFKFDPPKEITSNEIAEDDKEREQRCVKMFFAHKDAASNEKKYLTLFQSYILPLFDNDMKIITKIFDIRNLGRRILEWSYAYEYFLDQKSASLKIFKYLQKQLEIEMEKLCFNIEIQYRTKQKIEKAMKRVDLSIRTLLKHVDEDRMNA